MSKSMRWVLVAGLTTLVMVGCAAGGTGPAATRPPVPGIDSTLAAGDVSLQVLDAFRRETFQVSYIMHHPEPGTTFVQVELAIYGADDPVAWGEENVILVYPGGEGERVASRPTTGPHGLSTQYVYVYQVPEASGLADYRLQVAGGGAVPLASFGDRGPAEAPAGEPVQRGTVGGGEGNSATGRNATVGGGGYNVASASHTTVGGGRANQASVEYGVVGGGHNNSASGTRATVSGGMGNTAGQLDATVGGGAANTAGGTHATVAGGSHNLAAGRDASVGGGVNNQAAGTYATVAGGSENEAAGFGATVAGGAGNRAVENHATVGGGLGNQAAGIYGTVAGGQGNLAAGAYAAVPGGLLNQAAGDYSLAAGHRARVAPEHRGALLLADSTDADFSSAAADEFAVRATGGVRLVTAVDAQGDAAAGAALPAGSGSWASLSDRAAKENLTPVDGGEVLARVAELPIARWNYAAQEDSVRHIGPMAGDFHAAFGVGDDPRLISMVDADGVALAAVQELYRLAQAQEAELAAQGRRVVALEVGLAALALVLVGAAAALVILARRGTIAFRARLAPATGARKGSAG